MVKRVIKDPDIRRMEILNAAANLFESRGYEATPVEAIIKAAGIAKGTFYYYFKSKNEILQAIVEQIGAEMVEHFNSITLLENVTALEKFKCMIIGKKKKELTESSVMQVIHKAENRELQEELNIFTINKIAPLIAKVLMQGYEEGVFKKTISVECVQLILAGSQFILDSGLFTLSAKKRSTYLKEAEMLLEYLVGAKPGTFKFISNTE